MFILCEVKMKNKKDIYSEASRRTVENAKGCFFRIFMTAAWTRMDCHYFGCLRAQTGCEIYNKLEKDF